jgi:hypothetical protein
MAGEIDGQHWNRPAAQDRDERPEWSDSQRHEQPDPRGLHVALVPAHGVVANLASYPDSKAE